MELLTNFGIEGPLAMVLCVGLITLWKQYVSQEKTFADRKHEYNEQIQTLTNTNFEHSQNNRELIEYIKQNELYVCQGKWFVEQHKIDVNRCRNCVDYDTCPKVKDIKLTK